MNRKMKWISDCFVFFALLSSGGGRAIAEEKKEQLVWDAGTVQLQLKKLAHGVYAFRLFWMA